MATKPMAIWYRPWATTYTYISGMGIERTKDMERRRVHRPAPLQNQHCVQGYSCSRLSMCLCNFPGEIYVNKITNKIYNITIMCSTFEPAFRAWARLPFPTSIHSFVHLISLRFTGNCALQASSPLTTLCILNASVWISIGLFSRGKAWEILRQGRPKDGSATHSLQSTCQYH